MTKGCIMSCEDFLSELSWNQGLHANTVVQYSSVQYCFTTLQQMQGLNRRIRTNLHRAHRLYCTAHVWASQVLRSQMLGV